MTLPNTTARWVGAALATTLLSCSTHAGPPPASGPGEEGSARAVFEAVDAAVSRHAAPLAPPGVSWAAIVEAHRAEALAAPDADALYDVLDAMLLELGISHVAVMRPAEASAAPDAPGAPPVEGGLEADTLPPSAGPGDCGIDVRSIGGALYVSRVVPGSGAAEAGLVAGDSLVAVAHRGAAEALSGLVATTRTPAEAAIRHREWALGLCFGAAGSPVALTVERPEGPAVLSFPRAPMRGHLTRFGHLTVPGEVEARVLPSGVGYVRWSVFMMELLGPIEQALAGFAGAPGVVLDLRGNLGGVAGMSQAVAGHLVAERIDLGTSTSPDLTLSFPVFPRPAPYLGPLAILIDGASASTSEIFAVGLQQAGRGVVVGEASAGMVLPSVIVSLPDGGLLQYATAVYTAPDGAVL